MLPEKVAVMISASGSAVGFELGRVPVHLWPIDSSLWRIVTVASQTRSGIDGAVGPFVAFVDIVRVAPQGCPSGLYYCWHKIKGRRVS
jgi:hypothetical protein